MIEVLFWFCVTFVLYTYLGYPLLLFLLAKVCCNKHARGYSYDNPKISIVIAVHNEEKHIQKKINNLLNQKYPNDLFEIIVISDGSTDSTNDLMKRIFKSRETLKPKINFVVYERRRGKAYALNQGVRCAKGEILVFTDARQEFDSFALCELVANFNDPQVGAVTGELFLGETSKGGVHKAVELYWDYEKWIRRMEGNIDSVVGVTGAISAVRKSLYEPMPFGTILDDLFIPMSVVMKGFRVVFDDQAKAYDNQLIESKSEFRRKVRTAMGNFQVIQLLPGILSIRKNRILISFVSHKLFRLLIPYFLMAIFVLNWLKLEGIYSIVFAGQLAFYILALTGILVSANKVVFKLISVPYTYIVLNCAAVWGFIAFLRKDKSVWDKKK